MGGGGKAPAAPDYGPIAAANREAAEVQAQVAREQLAWAREQYDRDSSITNRVVTQLLGTMESEAAAGTADRERYQRVFQPIEDRLAQDSLADRDRYDRVFRPVEDALVQDAMADRARYRSDTVPLEQALAQDAATYNTQERQDLNAGRAVSDVTQAFESARRSAQANLESFGVDPSQTRAGALDLGVRTAQAAAAAGAANNARLETENIGRALRMDAINVGRASGADATARAAALGSSLQGSVGNAVNVGRGYPGQVASAFQTSQNAGQGAVGSNLNTTGSGASTMGTGVQWYGLSNGALGNWGGQVAGMNNAAMGANAQMSGQRSSMIGSLIGAGAGLALSPTMGLSNSLIGSLFARK